MTGEMATALTDHSRRQPSRRRLALLRVGLIAVFIPLLPVLLLLRLRSRPQGPSAFEALGARAAQIWPTSPTEAVALLKATFDQLIASEGVFGIKAIEIAPFGKFEGSDVLNLQRHLYNCELALGQYEEALAVAAAMPRLDEFVLQQVDCLVAMGRGSEAVALLQKNLDLDGWRGPLRRRLRELGGRDLRSVN
jgi:hypothetical protein